MDETNSGQETFEKQIHNLDTGTFAKGIIGAAGAIVIIMLGIALVPLSVTIPILVTCLVIIGGVILTR